MLYKVIAEHLETFLASLDDDPDATGLPDYVQREFYVTSNVASWPMGFYVWDVSPARKKSCWPL